MAKKATTTARTSAQRSKPRVQKSFAVVRPEGQELETEQVAATEYSSVPAATVASEPETVVEPEITAPKGSAAARLAARRQAAQKAQQRSTVSLLTPEHFAYVRRDLIMIAILATIMFTAIIVLYFTLGRA